MTDGSPVYSKTEGFEPFPQYDAADVTGMALSSPHSYGNLSLFLPKTKLLSESQVPYRITLKLNGTNIPPPCN